METKIYVDGKITAPEEAVIGVLDHGFLLGDSVYEVLWWHKGVLVQEREHLERLRQSAERLYMEIDATDDELVLAIAETLRAAGAEAEDDAYVRLMVTRGRGPLGLGFKDIPKRSVLVIVAPANRPGGDVWERGVRMAVVARRRNPTMALDPQAKTGNYLNNVLALHEAKLAGADDALMLNEQDEVTEATTSNVYLVRGDRLVTPPLAAGILRGTTRMRILALCAEAGISASETTVRLEDLLSADEIFISSSVRGILPVVRVDDTTIGDGTPGALTRRIRGLFEAAADADAARGVRS